MRSSSLLVGILFLANAYADGGVTQIRVSGRVSSNGVYEVIYGQAYPRPIFPLGTEVAIDFAFDRQRLVANPPVVIDLPNPTATPVFVVDYGFPESSAQSLHINPTQASISLGDFSSLIDSPQLRVNDNRLTGVAVGLSSSSWQGDEIEFGGIFAAPQFGEGVTLRMFGGLYSIIDLDALDSTNPLAIGTDIGDAAVWNAFPDSSVYLFVYDSEQRLRGSLSITIDSAVAIPEPPAAYLALATILLGVAVLIQRRRS